MSESHDDLLKWEGKSNDELLTEKNRIKMQLEALIGNIDSIELLSQLYIKTYIVSIENHSDNQELRERPYLQFLAALCLKTDYASKREPTDDEITKVIHLLKDYFDIGVVLLMPHRDHRIDPRIGNIVHKARAQKIMSQINFGAYRFQIDQVARDIFGKLDGFFRDSYGFTIADAINFQEKIGKRIERLYRERYRMAVDAMKDIQNKLNDPAHRDELRKAALEKDLSEPQLLYGRFAYVLETNTKALFMISPSSFCREEGIKDELAFQKYLDTLSCKFGEVVDLDGILDDNIVHRKPVIALGNGEYFPIIDVLANSYRVFSDLIPSETDNKTIWQRFRDIRGNHLESLASEYLTRIFPKENVFHNLHYYNGGEEGEIDTLIAYDNKIFIIEAKSAPLVEAAKRGASKSLERDLKKIIGDAYDQALRVIKYIKSSNSARFTDEKKTKTISTIENNNVDFIVINVTLEPLWHFATSLKDLQSIGLFSDNDFPWSVNIFDLDAITRTIKSPCIFIHYLQNRLRSSRDDVFLTSDEKELYSIYLEKGNLQVPIETDGKKLKIVLNSDYLDSFNRFLLYGMDPPKLVIESDLLEIITDLETSKPRGYSTIASALLDLDHQYRQLLLDKINNTITKTIGDGKMHTTVLTTEGWDIGFVFISVRNPEQLPDKLAFDSEAWKYQLKKNRWLGIGRIVVDKEMWINVFYYTEHTWIQNTQIEQLIGKPASLKQELKDNSKEEWPL